ncbi:flippase-like domain-containing protein [Arthrobacter sp. zg-ZUI100]|uniref:lysylphosphatidylglycerol synthase domain-containing protein n=1 Tax=Arthrobacter jiangjiafuii TaxID=2817475 RepID=UPI001AEE6EA2|nr:lysylphosphatidylglycerol synthase domain-containing protein [Arthrobacter jiangjiafuii]MBP3034798.1 flippase-like domain-containing protein [Arthrobacter jiangjiafuii]
MSQPESAPEAPRVVPATKRQGILDFARRALLVLVFVAAAYAIFSQWPEVKATVFAMAWWQWTAALILLVPGVLLGMMMWRVILLGILDSDHSAGIHRGGLNKIYLVGQLGKYVPGSVWAFVLQMELGRKQGLGRAQVFVASLISTGITVGASLVVGALALPALGDKEPALRWLYVLLPVVILAMHPRVVTLLVNLVLKIFRRAPLPTPIRAKIMIQSFILGVGMYAFFGIHLWLLSSHESGLEFSTLFFLTGALALGMTTGVVAFLLPAGIGAREAIVGLALASFMTVGAATAIALLSRLLFTVADLLCVGAAFLAKKKHVGDLS